MSRRIALLIAYEGTAYAGWQRQKNAVSIQQVMEEAVDQLFYEEVNLIASGRTDAGVHARGQVAAMDLVHPVPAASLTLALNTVLPQDIRVMGCQDAPEDFHPRYDAKRKTYRYSVYTDRVMPPQLRRTCMHESRSINWEMVSLAMQRMVGEHDFAAFHSTGSADRTTIRTLYETNVYEDLAEKNLYHIEVTGNGFLYNMVRIIAGTVLEIGAGARDITDIERAFETLDRQRAGVTAPACGLTLMNVKYENLGKFL